MLGIQSRKIHALDKLFLLLSCHASSRATESPSKDDSCGSANEKMAQIRFPGLFDGMLFFGVHRLSEKNTALVSSALSCRISQLRVASGMKAALLGRVSYISSFPYNLPPSKYYLHHAARQALTVRNWCCVRRSCAG